MAIKNFFTDLLREREEEQKALKAVKDIVIEKEKPLGIVPEQPKVDQEKELARPPELSDKEAEVLIKPASLPTTPTQPKPSKDPQLLEIERIMEEELEDVYQQMTPALQKKFKDKGEETAYKIVQLLNKAKVRAKEILELIKGWLKMIPGINRFFLEQEAKIKTDYILDLKEKEK